VSHAFAPLADRAQVNGVRFHNPRHSFCTRMVEAGVITRHKTLAMLQRYSHLSGFRKLELVRTAGPSSQRTNSSAS
jgi:integrase